MSTLAAALSTSGRAPSAEAAMPVSQAPSASAAGAATTEPGFTDNTPLTDDERIIHLLNRAAFGPRPGDVAAVRQVGIDAWIDEQLHPDRIDDSTVDAELAPLTALQEGDAQLAQEFRDGQRRNREIQLLIAAAEKQEKAQGAPVSSAGSPAWAGAYAPPSASAAAPGAVSMADGQGMTATAPGGDAAAMPPAAQALPGPQGDRLRTLWTAMTSEQQQEMLGLVREGRGRGIQQADTQLVVAKMVRAVDSRRQLQEVMVDFWSNHFNIDVRKNACRVYKVSDDREVIRKYALGRFRDLLEASARSPAMLVYLDNFQSSGPPRTSAAGGFYLAREEQRLQQQAAAGDTEAATRLAQLRNVQKRGAPGLNENYAREIMELHTLGVDGGYTQKDVTEVARCLTGWTIDRLTGEFQFNPRRHDDGAKVVLGTVIPAGGGVQDGETVLDILASSPATMHHVSYELCQRFVSDTPPPALVDACVATWRQTNGDIAAIVRTILTSDTFNSRVAYQQKIKSPFEYAVSAARALGGDYVAPDPGTSAMRPAAQGVELRANGGRGYNGGANLRFLPGQVAAMGEPLFQCQPPTGYPEDSRKWVSSGALIARLNFALTLTAGRLNDIDLAGGRDVIYGGLASLSAAEGTSYAASPAQFVNHLAAVLLHGEISPTTHATLLREANRLAESGAGTAGATARTASYPAGAGAADTASTVIDPGTARKLVALVLGSPEFQRR
jgi:uncharacterized protein (DUF1800 family)